MDPKTINEWLIASTPGIDDATKRRIKTAGDSPHDACVVNALPPHLVDALHPSLKALPPSISIDLDLNLPLPAENPLVAEFFERVYAELIDNALREFITDATERAEKDESQREYQLHVTGFLKGPSNNVFAVQLLDDGRGMPKQLVAYILRHIESQKDKPYKLPLDYRLQDGGHIGGYGLVMAVNYVLRLKGAFSIRANTGRGTKIRFDVPIANFNDILTFIPELAL